MTIWTFNKVDDKKGRELVYQSIKSGKSRFGWSQKDEHNLKLKDNWTNWHSKQLFLLEVRPGDWIVHINTPQWGKCIAVQVLSEYEFDDGLQCSWEQTSDIVSTLMLIQLLNLTAETQMFCLQSTLILGKDIIEFMRLMTSSNQSII
jgi:hypothetical protein